MEQALALAERGESGARATLPGHLFLIVGHDQLWVGQEPLHPALPTLDAPLALPAPGTIEGSGLSVTLQEVGRGALPAEWSALPPTVALLDAAAIAWPLQLRPPIPGERWAPLGMGGQEVNLRDWLAKHRVPPALRDHIPLLTDASGHVLWIVGWQVGHRARIRDGSARLLRVEVTVRG